MLIIVNIFIDKIHIDIDIVTLINKYALSKEYVFITEKSGLKTTILHFTFETPH